MLSASQQLAAASQSIREGGIVAYPTESVYGLGCDPSNNVALQKLLNLKKREPHKGLILIGNKISQFYNYIDPKAFAIRAEILKFWPGPVTWVLPCKPHLSALLTGGRNTLAVRITNHPIAASLCEANQSCIVSTSANISGQEPALTAAQIQSSFTDTPLDYIIDAPVGDNKNVSSIYDALTGKQLR